MQTSVTQSDRTVDHHPERGDISPEMRAAFSRRHERAALHPWEERLVREDMTVILARHRAGTGIADIAALTSAGYGDAIAIDIGCDIAVGQAVRNAEAQRAASDQPRAVHSFGRVAA